MPEDFVVTPWEVKGSVDYDRLVTQFGTERITPEILERIRKATGELHPMLRRGGFYSHRDLNWILDRYEQGTPFALYTGRGPSSGIHIGHMLPWFLTKWIQEKFRAKLYFQMTDDEKFLFKDFEDLEDATKVGYENILDIIAMDVAPKLGYPKPALIHNKLLPSLLGPGGKMSASIPESSIFTTDTETQARKKVMNAFTGGRATVEEQRRLGANPYICSIFAQYNYIFEPDDGDLAVVERTCKSGERLCGDCKAELWEKVRPWLKAHHAAREKAKDRVEEFVMRD